MPRRARLMAADVAVHLIQRGNNRQACFYQESDYLAYLDWLREYAQESECRIHAYFPGCYRYIELNPVRAGMVRHPGEYRWSSYRVNAQNEPTQLISPHQMYPALGKDAEGRVIAYRELFRHHLEPGLVDEIRMVTTGNHVVGSEQINSMRSCSILMMAPSP